MTKRAESLIDIFNLFKPLALTKEQRAFYQKTAAVRCGEDDEFYITLHDYIKESKMSARLLVVGHSGCGKSTELQMLMAELATSKISSIHINAMDDLHLYNFTYIDLLILVVDKTVNYAIDNNLQINEHLLSAFRLALGTRVTNDYFNDYDEAGGEASIGVAAKVPFFVEGSAKISASLRMSSGFNDEIRQEIKPKASEIINALNAFIESLEEQASQPIVIVIDGLEKCIHECVRRLLVEDNATLSNIKAHLVISCPIAVYRSADANALKSHFPTTFDMPMLKVHEKDGKPHDKGINLIRELILKRADESFFEYGVLETIIKKSGGSFRDTCFIVSNCAFHARKKETIGMESVNFVLNKFATEVFFRVKSVYYPRVKEIYSGNFDATHDSDLAELIYSGAVFEYNGERWVDLHPLLRDYIDRNEGILG